MTPRPRVARISRTAPVVAVGDRRSPPRPGARPSAIPRPPRARPRRSPLDQRHDGQAGVAGRRAPRQVGVEPAGQHHPGARGRGAVGAGGDERLVEQVEGDPRSRPPGGRSRSARRGRRSGRPSRSGRPRPARRPRRRRPSSTTSRAAPRGRGSPRPPRRARRAGRGSCRGPRRRPRPAGTSDAIRASTSRPPRRDGQVAQQRRAGALRHRDAGQAAPLDEVPGREGVAQLVARRLGHAEPVEHGAPSARRRPRRRAALGQAGRPQRLGEQGERLRVGARAPSPTSSMPAWRSSDARGRPGEGGRNARATYETRTGPGWSAIRVATRRATGIVRSGRSTRTRPAWSKSRKVSRRRPSWARSIDVGELEHRRHHLAVAERGRSARAARPRRRAAPAPPPRGRPCRPRGGRRPRRPRAPRPSHSRTRSMSAPRSRRRWSIRS